MKFIYTIAFILLFNFSLSAQQFSSIVNAALLEGSTSNHTLLVSGLPVNQNYSFGLFEVELNLTHPATNECTIVLYAPDGTSVILTNYQGNGADFSNTKFRSYATTHINNANSFVNKVLMPFNYFINFQNNSDPNGIWTLAYFDGNTNGVAGTLINWKLNFKNYPNRLATDSMECSLPIINFIMPSAIPNSPKLSGTMQVFSNGSNSVINTPTQTYTVGAELQGYTSSGGNKPNYDFEIRTTSGASLSAPLLGMPPESDWILKSGYTDNFMMKDPITFEFSRRMGYYAPRTKHVELFINGEYQGLYILMEKVKRGTNRIDVSKMKTSDTTGANLTGGYIFEINPNGAPADWYSNYLGYNGPNQNNNYEFKIVYPKKDSIQIPQKNYLHAFVDSFEDAMNSTNFQDTSVGWRKFVNEKSFIDFLIVSEYSMNYDTYGRSMYFNKPKSNKGNKINVGPPWDSDRGYEDWSLTAGWVHITTHGYWTFPFWWVKARQDSLFEKRLACRYKTQRKYTLTDTAITNYIDGLDVLITNAREREFILWNKYFEPIADLKYRIIYRLNWMDTSLQNIAFPPNPIVSNFTFLGNPINIFAGNTYKYNFRPGPDSSYFNPGVTGFYTAVIANEYGCESQKNFQVVLNTPLVADNIVLQGSTNGMFNNLTWHFLQNTNSPPNSELQHSEDGINFTTITTVNCSNSNCSYSHPPINSKNFYRIKIVDQNQLPQYSNTIVLVNSASVSKFIYPNPAKDVLYISNIVPDKINIYDFTGNLLISETNNTFEINIANLTTGTYTIVYYVGNQKMVEQFIKQ